MFPIAHKLGQEEPANLPEKRPITAEVMTQTLFLGCYDADVAEEDMRELLARYHRRFGGKPTTKLRHGDSLKWVGLTKTAHDAVKTLQSFLIHAGFLPARVGTNGFFEYTTLAGLRLFQLYERCYGQDDLKPDGVVGRGTWGVIKRWQDEGRTAEHWPRGQQTPEYAKWIALLRKAKKHYLEHEHLIPKTVDQTVATLNANDRLPPADTLAVTDWHTDDDEIHLIGIRRKEDTEGEGRRNDDLFILLINGLAFTFWGSTDPRQKDEKRSDEAFLAEGQHKFRFGWHNSRNPYQGLNPYERGVLVFRDDKANDNKLTEEDIKEGLDPAPNTTINIHWTGHGTGPSGTWSEGCQVIAGRTFLDPDGERQDFGSFAAAATSQIQANSPRSIRHSMAAYNVFTDLLLAFAPQPVDYLYYTLGRDDTLGAGGLDEQEGVALVDKKIDDLDLPRGLSFDEDLLG
jgi:hypothetical protein